MSTASNGYFILKNNEQIGPYTMNQLRGMWQNGAITGDLLYWQEGMPDWTPLSGILASLEPPATPLQPVFVAQADPFAHLHTKIQLKKPGRLSLIGKLGIGVGVVFVIGSLPMFGEASRNGETAQLPLLILTLGFVFIFGCYFWARKN